MNYIKYAQDNQKKYDYRIVKIEKDIITLRCQVCGVIKRMKLKTLYNHKKQIHNSFCLKSNKMENK